MTVLPIRPLRTDVHNPLAFGERIADKAATTIGSWKFIITQTVLVILWVILNITGIILKWDPYPFILLNLMFSVQAAYTGPILLLSSNRQQQKDRQRDDRDDAELGEVLNITRELNCLQKEQMASHKAQLDSLDTIIAKLGI